MKGRGDLFSEGRKSRQGRDYRTFSTPAPGTSRYRNFGLRTRTISHTNTFLALHQAWVKYQGQVALQLGII
jgi:hypothetical protein